MYGVETFRTFVNGWYDGDLQDVIFFEHKDPDHPAHDLLGARRYAWDRENPYTGPQSARRLRALAEVCRPPSADVRIAIAIPFHWMRWKLFSSFRGSALCGEPQHRRCHRHFPK